MTKENIINAINANVPFVITMADGEEYEVPHRDYISFTKNNTAVIVSTDGDYFSVLPLLTMTGILQRAPSGR